MKPILLITVTADQAVPAGLVEALRAAGGQAETMVLGNDFDALLDKLQDNVLPVVLKPDR